MVKTVSKPNKPGELRGVEVDAISLVSKAANKERFKIFKSADEETNADKEIISKDERGLFSILKEFFTGEKIEKGLVADTFNSREKARKLDDAFSSLIKVLGVSRYGEENQNLETDPIKIVEAIDDFRDLAIEIFLGANEVEKSGRKISGIRLAKIKEAHTILGDLIADTDNISIEEGGTETVTKEDLINEVKKSVDEAVQPINERLSALEKSEVKKEAEPNVADIVKSAMDEALKPVIERLERVEKARGLSNSQPEDVSVKKSTENFWAGAFGD